MTEEERDKEAVKQYFFFPLFYMNEGGPGNVTTHQQQPQQE